MSGLNLMRKILRALLLFCVALVGVAALLVLAFISPRDPARANQARVVCLLSRARPVLTGPAPSRIESVTLDDRVMLRPGHVEVASGYALRLNTQDSAFTIEAEPIRAGRTGTFSFFRDDSGVIRFEPELGKPAGKHSRPWSQ